MTDFDTCTCDTRPIKCPACCLASWEPYLTTPTNQPHERTATDA